MKTRVALSLLVMLGLTGAAVQASPHAPEHSSNVRLVEEIKLEWEPDPSIPVTGPTYMSEFAFRGRLMVAAVQGNHAAVRAGGDHYESGLATFLLGRRGEPTRQLGTFRCHSVGHLALWGDVVIHGAMRSTEAGNGTPRDRCDRNGLRLIDVSDPQRPRAAAFLPIPCGVSDLALARSGRRVYVYVPATCNEQTETFTNAGVFAEISVIRVDPGDPRSSKVVGIVDLLPMNGCSEIAVTLVRDLAVCVADVDLRYGLLDISDRAAPTFIEDSMTVTEYRPASPAFTWDGSHLILADNSGSGGTSSIVVYNIEDVTNPTLVGRWTVPDGPGEEELVYAITAVPMRDGRDIVVVAHANRGFWLLDITDPTAPRAIAYHVPAPEDVEPNPGDPREHLGKSNTIAAYWYNGRFYASDFDRLQVFRVDGFNRRTAYYFKGSYNPQTLLANFR